MANIYDMADTWNDGATTFSAIKMNVTDTASASGSLLMDLQVGGGSRFKVDKTGAVVISDGTSALTIDSSNGATTLLQTFSMVFQTSNALVMRHGNGDPFSIRAVSSGEGRLAFLNTSNTKQVELTPDAANTLAQRNGVNAQAFRVYGTYTDPSNFKRAYIGDDPYAAGTFAVGSLGAGTGGTPSLTLRGHTNSSIILQGASANIDFFGNLRAGSDNTYDIGAATTSRPRNFFQAGYWQTSEMTAPAAPAANSVRIYAEDDGAGKTRLMALFATGVAQQIAIEP